MPPRIRNQVAGAPAIALWFFQLLILVVLSDSSWWGPLMVLAAAALVVVGVVRMEGHRPIVCRAARFQ